MFDVLKTVVQFKKKGEGKVYDVPEALFPQGQASPVTGRFSAGARSQLHFPAGRLPVGMRQYCISERYTDAAKQVERRKRTRPQLRKENTTRYLSIIAVWRGFLRSVGQKRVETYCRSTSPPMCRSQLLLSRMSSAERVPFRKSTLPAQNRRSYFSRRNGSR